jgi:hypothetical protein
MIGSYIGGAAYETEPMAGAPYEIEPMAGAPYEIEGAAYVIGAAYVVGAIMPMAAPNSALEMTPS